MFVWVIRIYTEHYFLHPRTFLKKFPEGGLPPYLGDPPQGGTSLRLRLKAAEPSHANVITMFFRLLGRLVDFRRNLRFHVVLLAQNEGTSVWVERFRILSYVLNHNISSAAQMIFKYDEIVRVRGFWNPSDQTDVAFILRLEYCMKLQDPSKITHATEETMWFMCITYFCTFQFEQIFPSFYARAPHEVVSSFENHLGIWRKSVISCVSEVSATFQLKRMLPSFCAKNTTRNCKFLWKSLMAPKILWFCKKDFYRFSTQTVLSSFCA